MSGTFPIGSSDTPNWVPGYVPPAVEWNSWWSNKLDSSDPRLTGAPWLSEAGGTMTGALVLDGPPTQPLEAATKAYVDAISPAAGPFLPMSGGTMSGMLTLASNPVGMFDAVPKQYADAIGITANNALTLGQNALSRTGGTMTGALVLSGDPSLPLGAATKQYVDRFLPLAGGTVSGNVIVTGNINVNAEYVNTALYLGQSTNYEWSLSTNANGDKIQAYRANWYDLWSSTDGSRNWYSPSGQLMSLNGSGQLWTLNTASVGSNGIYYRAFGTHVFGFGFNGNINCFVDSAYQGDIALTSWVTSYTSGLYLPLAGGHVTGSIGCDGPSTFSNNLNVGGILSVTGNMSTNGAIGIGAAGQVGGVGWYYTGTGGNDAFSFWMNGNQIMCRVDGTYDAAIGNISDERLKQDIEPATFDCLAAIRRSKLYQFRFRKFGEDGVVSPAAPNAPLVPVGFVAQRQHEVFPDSVIEGATMSINLGAMVAALVGAVQTLADRFDKLAGASKEA